MNDIVKTYNPLQSVWYGHDAELIELMLNFYPKTTPQVIIDMNYNEGRFWKNSNRKVIKVDINPEFHPDYCCDNKQTPFTDNFADVIVYDPPHFTDQDTEHSSKVYVKRFGITGKGDNICSEFESFFKEAYRVLKDEGVCLCKISDNIHNHRYQWQHVEMIIAAQEIGFTACDCIVKARKVSMISGKWQNAHHARSYHYYWIVLRKSKSCE
jgi:hypothetical protein